VEKQQTPAGQREMENGKTHGKMCGKLLKRSQATKFRTDRGK